MRSLLLQGSLILFSILILVVNEAVLLFPQEVEPYALVKRAVFTSSGRSLPGVAVAIERIDKEKDTKKTRRKTRSDAIGEFAFRLPPGPAKWELTFEVKNFDQEKKGIEILADERVDLIVLLKPKP